MTGPTWRERLKPIELVAMAGVLALFTGGIAFAGTRQLDLAAIFAGVAFIAALLVLAMLALAAGDREAASDGRPVLDRYDGPAPEPTATPAEPTVAAHTDEAATKPPPAERPAPDED